MNNWSLVTNYPGLESDFYLVCLQSTPGQTDFGATVLGLKVDVLVGRLENICPLTDPSEPFFLHFFKNVI